MSQFTQSQVLYTLLGAFLTVWFASCGKAPETQPAATTAAAVAVVAYTHLPYAFSGNPFCWTDQVNVNGPSYQATGNTGYLCHTVGGSGGLDGQLFWFGLYADGTVSYKRRDGVDTLYTAFANPANCDLAFDNLDHSLRYVILQNGQVNNSGTLTSGHQIYLTNPPARTDELDIQCMLKTNYGVL